MTSESSQHGVHKTPFTQRFKDEYDKWNQESKTNHTETLKNEDERLNTDSKPPVRKQIYGFDNEINSLRNFLLDRKVYKEFKSLVILGEYGVGKTTLCKMIFNDEDVKSFYAPRIWVSMDSEESKVEQIDYKESKEEHIKKESKKNRMRKICVLKKILTGLGVTDLIFKSIREAAEDEYARDKEEGIVDGEAVDEKELSALLYALHLNLRWKKYLIVFDDVRKDDKRNDSWDEKLDEKLKESEKWGKYLSDGFPKGSGGRVIYTTRDETLAKELVAEEHQIHRLWPLSDRQSVWMIYEAAVVKKEKEVPRNDKKCIDELMNKSRGLPLALTQLAELNPVFLDDEQDFPTGTPDSDNNATSGENRNTTPP